MLSIKLPTITETVTLNGVPVEVQPLPLFFIENVQRAYPKPDKDTDPTAFGAWLRQWVAVRTIEALGLSGEVVYEAEPIDVDTSDPIVRVTELVGRPGWSQSSEWPAYAEACEDALAGAGFTTAHVNAISAAVDKLELRQLEALEPVGNS